mgnify:CR=1 FL=1
MAERGEPRDIGLDRLQLNLENPRHEEVEGRDEAMIELLSSEQVLELARDIVELGGINPMERMGVFPLNGTGGDEEPFYATAEGNRRLCALLLLDDPDAVPADMPNRARYVRSFTRLAQQLDPIDAIPCIVFETMDSARPWLERLHNGARDGTGRRRWTPEQQARNTSDRTNRAATQLRDLAISLDIVSAEDLARTTTTQQRFISNSRFRQTMGLVRLPDGSLERTSCWNDFVVKLRQFMADIVNAEINSRSHNTRRQIDEYAQALDEIEGLERRNVPQGVLERRPDEMREVNPEESEDQTAEGHEVDDNGEDEEGEADDASENGEEQDGYERPRRRNMIGIDDEIVAALHRLGNEKLIDLYLSIGNLRHPQHTLLAVIGCWSFLECVTRAHGRPDATAFDAWINQNARNLGVEGTPDRRLRRMALDWISNGGNITKHDWQGAAYDMRQLFNFMDALKPIIVAIIDDTADSQP